MCVGSANSLDGTRGPLTKKSSWTSASLRSKPRRRAVLHPLDHLVRHVPRESLRRTGGPDRSLGDERADVDLALVEPVCAEDRVDVDRVAAGRAGSFGLARREADAVEREHSDAESTTDP